MRAVILTYYNNYEFKKTKARKDLAALQTSIQQHKQRLSTSSETFAAQKRSLEDTIKAFGEQKENEAKEFDAKYYYYFL